MWPLLTALLYFTEGWPSIIFGGVGALGIFCELIDCIHERKTGEPYFQWSKKKDSSESYFDGGGDFGGGGGD